MSSNKNVVDWVVKNATDYDAAIKAFNNKTHQVYYDLEDYNHILLFDESFYDDYQADIAYELDQIFGGDWKKLVKDGVENFMVSCNRLNRSELDSTLIFDKIITENDAKNYYLTELKWDHNTSKIIMYDYNDPMRFYIDTTDSKCPEDLDQLFGGDWVWVRSNITDGWKKPVINDKVIDYWNETVEPSEISLDNLTLKSSTDSAKLNVQTQNYSDFSVNLNHFLISLEHLLTAKNKAYGNSALKPLNVFSKASSSDVILQQIDHKLSRIKNADNPSKNDTIDLIGYLTLYCIDQNWVNLSDLL